MKPEFPQPTKHNSRTGDPSRERIGKALELHRSGRLGAAERIYRALLDEEPDNPDALHLLGLVARQTGKLDEALDLIDRAIAQDPSVALYHNNRGYVLQDLGRSAESLAAYDEALRLDDGNAEAHNNRGNALALEGRLGDALAAYDRALDLDAAYAEAHYNRANALAAMGRLEDALAAFDAALAIRPEFAEAHNNKGNVLNALGRFTEALAAFDAAVRTAPDAAVAHVNRGMALNRLGRREDALLALEEALRLAPGLAEAHNSRGTVFQGLGRPDEALAAVERALELRPNFAEAENNRGSVLLALGRTAEALTAFEAATSLNPALAEAHNGRASALIELDRLDDALAALDEALRLKPDYAEANNNHGTILARKWRLAEALAAFDHALRLNPNYAEAHYNRGNVLAYRACIEDALESYRRALELAPDNLEAHSNYLFCLNYDPAIDMAASTAAHRAWGERFGQPENAFKDWTNPPDPDKTLNIGLVSADFLRHPTGYFLERVVAAADPDQLRFVYYSTGEREDDLTARLRAHAFAWRSVKDLSDLELAETIRADGIDILIDLSNHTAGNRLPCFALKPAPVQASWLGSCQTTGVPAIDYFLADPTYLAEGEACWFTEKLVWLPEIRWCYAPPAYAPGVATPPVRENGFVTFGSFNNLSKVNSQVIALWAHVLQAVPGSRLMLSWKTLADEGERARLTEAFAAHGIAADRLALTQGPASHAEVLGSYSRVDIALDPFPFCGGLTSCEALWMGVPLVTLPDIRPTSRQSLSFLRVLGRTEWVAQDADDYVRIAADLASDPDRLAALRRSQRERVAASAMCDAPRFAEDLQAVLRDIWRDWCAARPAKRLAKKTGMQPRRPVMPSRGPRIDTELAHGLDLLGAGDTEEAQCIADRVLESEPGNAAALHLSGLVAWKTGVPERALSAIRQATRNAPLVAEYHFDLGTLLQQQGDVDAAIHALDQALHLRPDWAQAHNARGNALKQGAHLDDALASFSRAVELDPEVAIFQTDRGEALRLLGHQEDAILAFDRALQLDPGVRAAHNNRGNALWDLGRHDEALASYDEAIRLDPDHWLAHYNRGNALRLLGRLLEALASLDQAVRLGPDNVEVHLNRGNVLKDLGRLNEALLSYDQALRLGPDRASVHNNCGNVFKDQGRLDEALAAYREALRLEPDLAMAENNYLFCLNYDPGTDDAALAAAHRAWGERFERPADGFETWANPRDPDKTLNIGLVSADFFRHPTGYFLDGVVAAAEPDRLRFVYYSAGTQEDDLTARLKAHAAAWRSVKRLSDRELAEAIRADGIDILIDLSGHTGGTRLSCFALKPAPVQVTWLGSCHTTGLSAIDYILMDPSYVPAGCEDWFVEEVVRLPEIRWCYTPPDHAPAVAEPPVLARGHVTFGSFNNLTKVNSGVIALWARLLAAVPDARLMLSWKTLIDAGERARLTEAFAAHGIAADRLVLTKGGGKHAQVLADYGNVDIALDTFPFSGCLTTCEALWMGVPVVTLPDTRPVSRQSLGLLTAIGRTEWVAQDADDYVRIATDLASDPDRLAALRRSQRERVAASPMGDAPRFARNLEAALRDIWHKWCSDGSPPRA
ncbi:MAG: tetratricopeptide repeat protein [Alphaproteobacteria bacterium]|nr:tetratricopeptide repeat protein [Alphaproteobacteria bacterium]